MGCPVCSRSFRLPLCADILDQECPVQPGEELIEISDQTAQLVLGEGNMEEWSQARFMLTLDIMYWYVAVTFSECGLTELVRTKAVARPSMLTILRLQVAVRGIQAPLFRSVVGSYDAASAQAYHRSFAFSAHAAEDLYVKSAK
jgi:hypothetical protein